jgi:acetylornithine deacetylase
VPKTGINAVSAIAPVLERIDSYAAELASQPHERFLTVFPDSPYATLSVLGIRGGGSTNIVPEHCTIDVSYRPLPGEDPLDVFHEITRRLNDRPIFQYGPSAGPVEVLFTKPHVVPGMLSRRDATLEQALSAATGAVGSSGAPYGTDGCMFAGAGIDTLICGPGDIDEAHRPNESIDRVAFERGHEVIQSVVARCCGA